MADLMISNLDRDGEGRIFKAHGHAVVADAGGITMMRTVFEPGWRWSEDVAPLAGTTSCQIRHLGYVLSGSMHVRMDDGTEADLTPGDLIDLAPGHDAWVTGDTACEMIDISPDVTRYAVGRTPGLDAADDTAMTLVRRGYEAFNTGDLETLIELFAEDVVQHVPGNGPLAGTYKGIESVLGYYGQLAAMSDGTFRAHLVDVHGDGLGHVCATHQISATRNGVRRVSRGSILFTFVGEKVTDLLELHGDLPGDDAFFA